MENKSKTFEASISRLDEIVKTMEKGEIPLDQALALFQEGTTLVKDCNQLLDEAEQKVTLLTKGPDGEPVEREISDHG